MRKQLHFSTNLWICVFLLTLQYVAERSQENKCVKTIDRMNAKWECSRERFEEESFYWIDEMKGDDIVKNFFQHGEPGAMGKHADSSTTDNGGAHFESLWSVFKIWKPKKVLRCVSGGIGRGYLPHLGPDQGRPFRLRISQTIPQTNETYWSWGLEKFVLSVLWL